MLAVGHTYGHEMFASSSGARSESPRLQEALRKAEYGAERIIDAEHDVLSKQSIKKRKRAKRALDMGNSFFWSWSTASEEKAYQRSSYYRE